MQIEKGDYFIVERGFELNTRGMSSFASLLGFPEPKQDDRPQYDRSYNGLIFEALEVCGVMVAARCVVSTKGWGDDVGEVLSLHTNELELMTVTREYVDSIRGLLVREEATDGHQQTT